MLPSAANREGLAKPAARGDHLILFFALAYGFSWLVFAPMVLFRLPPQVTILATLGPTIAALIVHRRAHGNYRAFRVFTTWPRTLLSTAVGVCLIVLTFVILPGFVTGDARKLHWSILASASVYNYSTLLGGPLGEEPGWRGYALPRLELRLGPVRGTALLAILWTGWHLPLFLMPGWTTATVWSFGLIELGLSGLLTFGANLGRFDVIPCIAMHAEFNTASRYLNGLFRDIQPNMKLPLEVVLGLCGIAMTLVLIAATKGDLMFRREHASGGGK